MPTFVIGPADPETYKPPTVGVGTIGTTNDILPAFFSYFATHKPGDVVKFAGGTLTMLKGDIYNNNPAQYKDASGFTYTFDYLTPLSKIATEAKPIGVAWAEQFGYHPF